ncbi:MAG: DUF167 family protein [Gammaproteobacteria bacterium]|nr:DUF167 family protein [Gammaproteobacteria bacterium]
MSWYRWQGEQLLLNLRIQPKSSRDEIVGPYGEGDDEMLKVKITAPPVDGKANDHLIKYLAKQFGVVRSAIELLSGESGRNKRIIINRPQKIPQKLSINR